MTKVAVIYSGQPRSFLDVLPDHDRFLKGLNVDSYHSTWNHASQEEWEIIHKDPNIVKTDTVDYNIPDRGDLYRFEQLLLGNKPNHPIFMLGRIQYMTSILANKEWAKLRTYDYVVRLRYDFKYEGQLIHMLPQTEKVNDICITRKMGGKSSHINIWDGFAFGKPFAMSLYFDFHRWIPFSLFNQDIFNWKFQPEFVYGTYLRTVNLNVIDCGVQPVHVYPKGKDIDWHRTERTIQYYRDLATFHPQFYKQQNSKLIIENDSPTVSDGLIIKRLKEEGIDCQNV